MSRVTDITKYKPDAKNYKGGNSVHAVFFKFIFAPNWKERKTRSPEPTFTISKLLFKKDALNTFRSVKDLAFEYFEYKINSRSQETSIITMATGPT